MIFEGGIFWIVKLMFCWFMVVKYENIDEVVR